MPLVCYSPHGTQQKGQGWPGLHAGHDLSERGPRTSVTALSVVLISRPQLLKRPALVCPCPRQTGTRGGVLLGGRKRGGLKAQQLFKAPKATVSRRSLLPELVTELLALRHKQETQKRLLGDRYTDHGLVFCQANWKPLQAHNIARRDFRRVLVPKGLPRMGSTTCGTPQRHSTWPAGGHPKVVAGLLGHASVQIALDAYSHAIPGALQEDATYQLAAHLVATSEGIR